jgi:hypothetical protein
MYNKNYEQYANIAKQAESLDQLQAAQRHIAGAIQSDVLKPYEGIPLVQDLTGRIKQAQQAQQAMMFQQFAPQGQMAPQGQPAQPAPPIAPQVMAQAPGLQALPPRQSGVAALPSGIDQESFAGGGIVAFAKGGQSFEDKLRELQYGPEDDNAEIERNPLFRRLFNKALGKFPSMGSFRENLAGYMPAKSQDADAQAGGFYGGRAPAPTAGPTFDPTAGGTYNPEQKAPSREVVRAAPPVNPVTPPPPPPQAQAEVPQAVSPQDEIAKQFAPLEQMLQENRTTSAKAREDDKWSRIMEAGFNMMAGSSPYALTNIGTGAAQAMKGYQSDVANARKEEADTIKSMISLGMKKNEMAQALGLKTRELDQEMKKLGITEAYYKAHYPLLEAQAKAYNAKATGAGAGVGANTKLTIAQANNAQRILKDLQKSASDPMSPNYGKSYDELETIAINSAARMAGGEVSAAPPTNTISWSTLGKK